ncbi:centaurin-gamma-1A isoform X4 [Bacillus rossius redtenbacheri]|uniref:centaurin-gamma-1A isoform X4 n=1 Tax=Bacillus rossius redtenbacheri TaxID=93214 RepID=UPI002FDD8C06
MPAESFFRSIRRRSLRVKRSKSLVLDEKRKSDSFVNSQEWTLSRAVPDLRLGIVGSLSSGKSALVHRYLTGSYMQEESPEGGRFKKEILVDGHSYLLLIRDEGGPPELQFTAWVDAVIFVFSLENEASFNAIYNYYTKMAHFRNSAEIPLILVGTQDAISENNPRVIDDSRARKLAVDLKRCTYYETCATYGLNVERVFQDACQKIVQQRLSDSRPSTPNSHGAPGPLGPRHQHQSAAPSPTNNGFTSGSSPLTSGGSPAGNAHKEAISVSAVGPTRQVHTLSSCHRAQDEKWLGSATTLDNNNPAPGAKDKDKDLPTPSSTPTTSRKSRRRSNLFTPSKKGDDRLKNGELGSGRAIPVKQGYLYKRSSKALNKDWKKKYVTLCDDGRLTYHPSLHDYMDDVHGKEISLQYVTVKVPGQKPRGSKSMNTATATNNGISDGFSGLAITNTDGYEFFIVSLDNKQWHFEAGSSEERDEWVMAIEQQILNSLQGNESSKSKSRLNSCVDTTAIQSIRTRVPGNSHCVDCDAANPDWASLNLGVLMCIECSGIHRNLGSHISRVRSLDLDEWPPGHLSVMTALGNALANSVWEASTRNRTKPAPSASREEKERWIRSKYESKEFLAAASQGVPLGQQLIDAVCRSDTKLVVTVLAHATAEHVNARVSSRDLRTPLHLACATGNLAMAQLLMWHGADARAVDHEGRTCLAYARAAAGLALARGGGGGGEAGVLAELLQAHGCAEASSGTLPRRRLDKLPSSVI